MEQPTLVLTPGFLDDLMNGKADIIAMGEARMVVKYDSIRIQRTGKGVCVDFMANNKAVAGFAEVILPAGNSVLIDGLQGNLDASIS